LQATRSSGRRPIAVGKPHHFGPILVRLCGPCKSGASGSKQVSALNARLIRSGNAFITLITNKNPNGEIRGQFRSRVGVA
jgi:CHRD domain